MINRTPARADFDPLDRQWLVGSREQLRSNGQAGRTEVAERLVVPLKPGYLSRARAAGVVWPLPEDLDDAQLEALLFPLPPAIASDQRPMPDWAWVHRELRRPDVTLALLWDEFRAGAPDGFSYSWYCDLYRAWRAG
jgi:hypothetical protein